MTVVCKKAFDTKRRGRCKKLSKKSRKIKLCQWGYTGREI